VPFLPGHQAVDPQKVYHGKRQLLAYSREAPVDQLPPQLLKQSSKVPPVPLVDLSLLKQTGHPAFRLDTSTRSLTHEERLTERESARNTYRPNVQPAWLKHDRQVLRFSGYYQEPVYENPNENFRVRLCQLLFYLEDGTMQVQEPKIENSGLPQGTIVKRHRFPKPEQQGGNYYAPADLKCGATMHIYGKTFKLLDADEFTRWFYTNAAHMDIGDPEPAPLDPFRQAKLHTDSQKPLTTREVADGREYTELRLGGNRKNAKLEQFLANDRRVLCFQAYWDDSTNYGSRNYYTFHYYLADDTVDLLEVLGRNSGRDPYPNFWRRSPLRKNPCISVAPGMLEPDAVLVKPEDLQVGSTIDVLGRDIMLYDCDSFTRDFYRNYMNAEQGSIEIVEPEKVHVRLSHPPHTGFGSEEDSLACCKHLSPRPPRKDYQKLMGNDGMILRFEAQLRNGKPEDQNRLFIVGFFMADDSVAVWEQRARNSGHTEGKFAERSRKRNYATGAWFQMEDFEVGRDVVINACPFHLLRADEASLKIMEQLKG